MPRAVDSGQLDLSHDPTREISYEFFGEENVAIIETFLSAIKDTVVQLIKELTGIDLESFEGLIESLSGFLGMSLSALAALNPVTLIQKFLNAFIGIDLDGTPGAILEAITNGIEGVVDFLYDKTGLNFGSWSELLESFRDGKGIDLALIPDLLEGITEAASSFAQLILKVTNIDSLIEILTNIPGGGLDGVADFVGEVVGGITNTIDNIVRGLFGWLGFGYSHEDAEEALADNAATVASLTAQVAALTNDQNNQAVGGKSALIDFRLRPKGTGAGSDFGLFYSGPGTGYLAITNGALDWVNNGSHDPRKGLMTYNDIQTATDYMRVGYAFGSAPEWGISNPAKNYIHARKNAAGDTYVYADLAKRRVELGCVVSGVKTVFTVDSDDFSFKSNTVYWLECGTIGGLRVFRVLEGNDPVLSHAEVGTTSQLGPNYRSGGGGVYTYANNFATNRPGKMLAFAIADNYPPAVLGSGVTLVRTSTGNVNGDSGENLFPNNFFNSVGENTLDMGWSLTNGRITASLAGWYTVTARVKINTASTSPPNHLALILYKGAAGASTPSVFRYIGDDQTNDNVDAEGISGNSSVYLNAGEYLQLGYYASASNNNFFTGEALGAQCYITVALGNRSLA